MYVFLRDRDRGRRVILRARNPVNLHRNSSRVTLGLGLVAQRAILHVTRVSEFLIARVIATSI